MKHLILCALILSFDLAATAQADTSARGNTLKDSVTSKRTLPVNFMPEPSVIPYFSVYSDSMQANNKKPVPYRYKYVPDKNHSAMFNVTGLLLLGYFGYKTDHPYQYNPGNPPH